MAILLQEKLAGDIVRGAHEPVDAETLAGAQAIVSAVRDGGDLALRDYAQRFGDIEPGGALLLGKDELAAALASLPADDRAVLERVAARIRSFASAQRASLIDMNMDGPMGRMGHRFQAVERAGCYAPGGRFPLPSSVLMTAVTARAAGVSEVIVASPRAGIVTQAAAAVAGVDALLCVGGAQGIAALAYGTASLPAVDVIVGPGNRWVTAAKHLVSAHVGIDMLAGPSELVVVADDSADPAMVAADLLAQAEHDDDALPILLTDSRAFYQSVNAELALQVEALPTRTTALAALRNGFAVITQDLFQAMVVANRLAPEHLEIHARDELALAGFAQHYGGLFVGNNAAEVFGDYGVGPNHVLPTGGRARFTGGLSVLHFLRMRTFIESDGKRGDDIAIADCVRLAELEGLAGHANAAAKRRAHSG